MPIWVPHNAVLVMFVSHCSRSVCSAEVLARDPLPSGIEIEMEEVDVAAQPGTAPRVKMVADLTRWMRTALEKCVPATKVP